MDPKLNTPQLLEAITNNRYSKTPSAIANNLVRAYSVDEAMAVVLLVCAAASTAAKGGPEVNLTKQRRAGAAAAFWDAVRVRLDKKRT